MQIKIRKGQANDADQLLAFIKELAAYEKASNEVEVNVAELIKDGFGPNPLFQFIVAQNGDETVGIALYYYKYSTWKGKTMFLEDLIVKEEHRKYGIGRKLFVEICKIAHLEGCRRMDWQVLDWNTPAIEFYKKFNAKLDPEWLDGRLFKEGLAQIYKENS